MGTGNDDAERQWRLTRQAMDEAGLTIGMVWLRYFSLTGKAGEYEVDAYLNGLLVLPELQRDLVSHAVNELIDEKSGPRRAPYSRGADGDGKLHERQDESEDK
ncbi:hypothetical protein [Sinomonas humi]|uniref:Uncharacterized protein n=1 Tax=Sinomonas humi TaxID=1338436 RepID=A0A0B2AQS8_9MICC|nr:hypothetical protein [Sinomonas humi]KHL04334.1 hypothetical protein LK10_05185 [Sinomonas humi]